MAFRGEFLRTNFLQSIVVMVLMLCFGGTHAVRAEDQPLQRYEFLQIRMGIPVNLVVYAASEAAAQQGADAAYHRIKQLDRIMSDYDPESELMQLCSRATPQFWQPVSPELFLVLEQSLDLSRKSAGAFDVSVGPLVKLWRVARRQKSLPDPAALAAAKAKVGFEQIRLRPEQREVQLGLPGMQLDLGAIAKGYAADEALRVLREAGLPCALVEAGGDISVGSPPPGRDHWTIQVEKLKGETGQPVELRLAHAAVATSGDAYQFLEIDGQRYSHLLDPHTGLGITRPGSVSVIAKNGMLADGLASAVSVLGPDKGLELLESIPDTEALILLAQTGDDGQLVVQRTATPNFNSYLSSSTTPE